VAQVGGQIRVTDGGKIQPTGLAPVWIYDATNVQLTANIPLPVFGGRTRDDWQRIVKACPNSLSVYSNYETLVPLAPAAEVKRIAKADECVKMREKLNGQTNGPDFTALEKLRAEWRQLMTEEDRLWDQEDDRGELIVLWYNLNPGILYSAGLPKPFATAQTDPDGHFTFTIPVNKPVLIAAHINGAVHGQAGNYFWLLPYDPAHAGTNLVLNGDNARCKRTQARMPQVILPETNGYIGSVGFWSIHRLRDSTMNVKFEAP
jgi:hypothetical protein